MNTTPESLPVVTILIATFNSEKILPRTLEGIKKQSYPQDKLTCWLWMAAAPTAPMP